MTIYGTPDFWRPPSPAGQVIVGSNGYAAATMTFPLQDVTDYGTLAVRLRPTGTITGYVLSLKFYTDPAATHLIETYNWHSFSGSYIMDEIVPPSRYCIISFTPAATGGGQTFDFFLLGFAGAVPRRHMDNTGYLVANGQGLAAGASWSQFATATYVGPAYFSFNTDATNWHVQIDGWTFNGVIAQFVLNASQANHSTAFQQTVSLAGLTYRVFVQNDDAVARTLTATLATA